MPLTFPDPGPHFQQEYPSLKADPAHYNTLLLMRFSADHDNWIVFL